MEHTEQPHTARAATECFKHTPYMRPGIRHTGATSFPVINSVDGRSSVGYNNRGLKNSIKIINACYIFFSAPTTYQKHETKTLSDPSMYSFLFYYLPGFYLQHLGTLLTRVELHSRLSTILTITSLLSF